MATSVKKERNERTSWLSPMWRDIDSLRKQNESIDREIEQLRSEKETLRRQNKSLSLIKSVGLDQILDSSDPRPLQRRLADLGCHPDDIHVLIRKLGLELEERNPVLRSASTEDVQSTWRVEEINALSEVIEQVGLRRNGPATHATPLSRLLENGMSIRRPEVTFTFGRSYSPLVPSLKSRKEAAKA